ncbi:hypothetical protein ABT297_39600 [Dactylosporangium sp. NPDC000555]|uniref:hypothetical protein n=1 Tax=Dactylosporangium sp. NPDC000555 TaxID=3154260 RepID=UPI003326DC22
MFKLPKAIAALAVVPMAASLVAVGLIAGPAAADPPPPTGASYCGVGSDTTQDVIQKLAGTLTSSTGKKFESWNATGSSSIITNCPPPSGTGVAIPRPDGSSQGIAALLLAARPNSSGTPSPAGTQACPNTPAQVAGYCARGGLTAGNQVTFARSSRGPALAGNALTFVPFGTDAVDYAVKAGGGLDQSFAAGGAFAGGLSVAQLQNIYKCDPAFRTVTAGGVAYTIQPYVPQAGSGTRSFFLGLVGITEADVNKVGGCVRDTKVNTGASIQEHDGNVLTDPTVGATRYTEIAPISIAQNIAQTNNAVTGVVDRRGNSKLGILAGAAPTSGSGGTLAISSTFVSTNPAFTRPVYNVFPTWKVTGLFADTDLVNLFVSGSSKVCASTFTIGQYGFLTSPSTCGSTTTRGDA